MTASAPAVLEVKPARLMDVWRLSALAREASSNDYGFYAPEIQRLIARRNSWRPLLIGLLSRRRLVLVGLRGDRIAGFIVATPDSDGVAIVHWLYVEPGSRGVGLARLLLDRLDALLPARVHKLMLWTEIAAEYYKRLGWTEAAVLPRHWWGQDFAIMTRDRAGRGGSG